MISVQHLLILTVPSVRTADDGCCDRIKLCGTSPDGRIVEMIEIPDHPWFLATQAHPEFKSRPNRPHPLFKGFVEAAVKNSIK